MAFKEWGFDLIGVLASDEYVLAQKGGDSVFINTQNSLQFSVRLISETPESFLNVDLFTGYFSDIANSGFEDDYYNDRLDRITALKKFLNNYLLIFKPVSKGDHFHISDVRLIEKPNGYNEKSTFVPVPIFSQERHNNTLNGFESDLYNNKFVGKIEGISTDVDDTPGLVLWKEMDDSYYVLGEFEKHRYAYGGFQFQFKELRKYEFNKDWIDYIAKDPYNDSLLFIESDIYLNMCNKLLQASFVNCNKLAESLQNTEQNADKSLSSLDGSIGEQSEVKQNSEEEFLERLFQLRKEEGLVYDEKDLINFHTAMKSSNLVILSGMSGTGKSRLIQVYGKALGMDELQLNIIPVRPSWTDDSDLIGYVDSIHMVYRPGDSGLINTLIQASKEENVHNKIYIICFDEMNLARVEHYFSQFLSVLEMEPQHRKLRLYNDELETRLYNSKQYPPIVNIGDNVMFVGTVNIDESTYHFSDKVLDRANVISLNVLPFDELKNLNLEKKRERKPKKEWTTLTEFRSFKTSVQEFDLSEREVSFFTKFHKCLQTQNMNFGIGYRIVRNIDAYLKNLPQNSILTRREALDLQIIQRILTKFRGPEEQLKMLVGVFLDGEGILVNSSIINILDEYHDISDFENARKVIKQKAKELKMYGYTL